MLPKVDTPVFELDLPVSKKHIRHRPFLVKEQKNLLMAMESDDTETINNNIKFFTIIIFVCFYKFHFFSLSLISYYKNNYTRIPKIVKYYFAQL